jgi:hypothetical protein
MRSLLPFDVVMVPLPDQEPDIAANGLLKACAEVGSAASPRRAAAAKTDFTLLFKYLLDENMVSLPSLLFLIGSRNFLKKGSCRLESFG